MFGKEKRLNRTELLGLVVQLSEENDSLRAENDELRAHLADKRITLHKAGSIAEASLRLSGVFEAAQEAADRYLSSLKAQGLNHEQVNEAESVAQAPSTPVGAQPSQDAQDTNALSSQSEEVRLSEAEVKQKTVAAVVRSVDGSGVVPTHARPSEEDWKEASTSEQKKPTHASWR